MAGFWDGKSVIVTGGAGFLGSFLVEALQRAGAGSIFVPRSAQYNLVDGEATRIELRADYVVTRQGRRYVAEVKTGRVAPRIETASTRRQLLEYRHAFDVDGVLLVDADARRIHLVELPPARPVVPRTFPFVGWAAVLAALALAVLLLAR